MFERDRTERDDEQPIVKLVNRMIEDAHQRGASRLRVLPAEKHSQVDHEVDGDYQERMRLPQQAHDNVINRLKIMADLRPEKHLAQSGTIQFGKFTRKNLDIELKIEISPMEHGQQALVFVPPAKAP